MKKFLFLLAAIIMLKHVTAQSFEKSSIVISACYSFDYNDLSQQVNQYNIPNSLQSLSSKAISGSWNFEGEFGLFKWLGLGAQFKLDNYTTSTNPTTGARVTAAGFETGITANLHLIRNDRFNLLLGADVGYSQLTYSTNDGFNDQVSGNGSWIDFHATARFYFGRFGLNFTAYIPETNYETLSSSSSNWKSGEDILASWKGTGGGVSAGIQYRIVN
jgi:opacity protein-like surface antigen